MPEQGQADFGVKDLGSFSLMFLVHIGLVTAVSCVGACQAPGRYSNPSVGPDDWDGIIACFLLTDFPLADCIQFILPTFLCIPQKCWPTVSETEV